ncbi:MAG: DUF2589 domain-containing protein [Porphyromonadaceae bacterium]|nr:DUF2589 domain-containing protein [Porphyromonadaceae bacterium]
MSNTLPRMDIGLADLIKEAHVSTLKAEQMGLEEYLRILGQLRDMPPISFGYTDDQGRRLRLQIPVITLVPLSLLRIEEAEFSCSCRLELNTQTKKSDTQTQAPRLATTNDSIDKSRALTEYYDKKQNKRVYALQISVYQSLVNPNKLTFQIIDRSGNKSYYKSDPTKSLQNKRCVLLSLGRPYITLWEEKLGDDKIKEFEWNNRLLISLYGDGSLWHQGNTYQRNSSSTKEVRIEFPLDGRRYDYAHKHIAWRFLLHTKVSELARQDDSSAKVTMTSQNQQTEQSNFTIRIKLKQSPLPAGFADIFRGMGNNTRLSEEY